MVVRRDEIPSTSALVAFESAARHCNFSRAAEELNTSQSAISRHIAGLEARLGARLFERHKQRLRLSEQGDHFYRAVVSGLENIRTAANRIAATAGGDHLTIACTHEISHLCLLPRFSALQAAVGDEVEIRILTAEYEALERSVDPRIDLLFSYRPGARSGQNQVVVFDEAVTPVCAPEFAKAHRSVLSKPTSAWGSLPFLQLTKANLGWATWDDWFDVAGTPKVTPKFLRFDNYVYLLEAAAAGRGLALGWRALVERYLETGTLVAGANHFVELDRPLYALLTARGQGHPAARKGLAFLDQMNACGGRSSL